MDRRYQTGKAQRCRVLWVASQGTGGVSVERECRLPLWPRAKLQDSFRDDLSHRSIQFSERLASLLGIFASQFQPEGGRQLLPPLALLPACQKRHAQVITVDVKSRRFLHALLQ